MNTVERFSNRVENYVKYRPGYPPQVLQLFREGLDLTIASVLADVGSGTGISSRLFLENGNIVYGVEPNAAMREAAETIFKNFDNFKSVDGTAEDTTLPSNSIDIVIAAQAFHWFDPNRARAEFKRIVKPGGFIALIWNERQLDSTPFLKEYEAFLLKWGNDYQKVRHENIDEKRLAEFFGQPFERAVFANSQSFDLDGLMGRLLSASYMPARTDPHFPELESELRSLFDKHSENGRIRIFYDTRIFYTQI